MSHGLVIPEHPAGEMHLNPEENRISIRRQVLGAIAAHIQAKKQQELDGYALASRQLMEPRE